MGGKSSVVNPLGKNFLGGGVVGRGLGAGVTGGLSEFTKKNPFGAPINNPMAMYQDQAQNQAIPGPFQLDQGQFDGDRAAINAEGDKQYQETLTGLGDVSKANTKRASDLFSQMLPDIAENSQAAHLFDSTGYGQEVARQQSNIASDISNREAQARMDALTGKQGFSTGALQRGLSLEDFTNQANVAKTIGAQMAPQMPSGKATGLSGGVAGAGAGAPFGPIGAGVGGLAGLIMGANANKKGK